ncbi:hypothetical protein PTE_03118 [Photorhabdus khanii NC19]|uniref:Transposase n=1 Tax=Photorhabdus khanii NC19 TaxID=1004151 RepID=W3V7Z7_9GAMM|nr:hypothetical protein [Photorhabdus khanii]ETS31164.1 hypothetical protein PTE_03118 [Photorhabdus khanii NC19]
MQDGLTLRESVKRTGIDLTTAFRWRHRFLASAAANNINIPERSFLRSTFNENKGKYANKLAKSIKSELKNNGDPQQALEKLGEIVARDVKRKIQAGIDPPLSQATIKRKKSSKPLIETGQLLQSITYEVRGD